MSPGPLSLTFCLSYEFLINCFLNYSLILLPITFSFLVLDSEKPNHGFEMVRCFVYVSRYINSDAVVPAEILMLS